MSRIPVVIAGGGTVGLATAVFLGHHGVTSLVLERRAAPSDHPRALGISWRTLEFFREVGLSGEVDAVAVRSTVLGKWDAPSAAAIDRLRAAQPKPGELRSGRTDSGSGSGFGVGVGVGAAVPYSPVTSLGHYPQDRLDSVLLPAARERGATIEFGIAVTGVEQDADSVAATLSDGRVIRADYLVGADGVNTSVRPALGIGTTGPGVIGAATVNILFEADLIGRFGSMPTMTQITHPDSPGVLLAVGDRRWVLHVAPPPGGGISEEHCAQAVRTALGADDVPVEIVSVIPWRATVRMADRFRSGRAFLVGDAARAISPLGAFGLNTGLADAHNLAWKLAMVLRRQAGDRLLDSYHEERHPTAQLVTRQALLRWDNPRLHWDPAAVAERAAVGAWKAPMVTMGYRYDSSAVIDGVAQPPSTEDVMASLDGAPGSRLPHRWLDDASTVSTLDLGESRFMVLAGPTGEHWCEAARKAAASLGMELRAVRLGREAASSLRLGNDGALLVRPDNFVAWRSSGPGEAAKLEDVLAAVTGRAS